MVKNNIYVTNWGGRLEDPAKILGWESPRGSRELSAVFVSKYWLVREKQVQTTHTPSWWRICLILAAEFSPTVSIAVRGPPRSDWARALSERKLSHMIARQYHLRKRIFSTKFNCLGLRQSYHLHVRDGQTCSKNGIQYFPESSITIWLNDSKCPKQRLPHIWIKRWKTAFYIKLKHSNAIRVHLVSLVPSSALVNSSPKSITRSWRLWTAIVAPT